MAFNLDKFLVLALLTLYVPVFFLGIFDLDEGAFASSSLQMLRDNQFLIPYLGDELRLEKPIFTYWIQAFSVSIFGINEFALRFPSVVASIAWGVCFADFVKKNNTQISKTSVFLNLISLPGVFIISFATTADAFLNLFISLAFINLFNYSNTPSNSTILKASFYIALGFLTKGFTIIAICGPVIFLYLLSQRKLNIFLKIIFNWRPWLLFSFLTVPWIYFLSQKIIGTDLNYLFFSQSFGRFAETFEDHNGPIYYYLFVLPFLVLPYFFDFTKGLRNLHLRLNQFDLFMFIWFSFVLLFFSFSSTKLPHYILYGISPVAYIVSKQHQFDKSLKTSISFWIFTILIWVLMYAFPLILNYLNEVTLSFEFSAQILKDFASDKIYTSICFLMIVFSTIWFFSKQNSNNLKRITAVVLVGLISMKILPYLSEALQGDIKKLGLKAKAINEPISMFKINKPSFSFYAQKNSLRGLGKSELIFTRTDKIKYLDNDFDIVSQSGEYLILRIKNG